MAEDFRVARQVILDEAESLRAVADALDEHFEAVLKTVRGCTQVIVSGIGKSGIIGQKIAATLTSTGTPAVFLHPVEALHGDLGIVTERHCLLALSRSGNTDEIVRFVQHFRRLGGPVIGVTCGPQSRLAELSAHVLTLPDLPEAGPLSLAPTTSCCMMLALGDALAMSLLHSRGFGAADFAQYHPEGTLGRRLLLRAADLMHEGERLPLVRAGQPFDQLLMEMTRQGLGLALIVDDGGHLLGTFTDGDLRRLLERAADVRRLDARAAYAQSRRTASAPPVHVSAIPPTRPAVECLQAMRDAQITSLIVVNDDGRPIGVLRLLDLIRAGL